MTVRTRVTFFDDNNEKFFGEGPCTLMHEIEKTGSLRAAAQSMNMAYSKAHHIIKHAELSLGFSLTEKTTGGKTGGGSVLTERGKEWLRRYEEYRTACVECNGELYKKYFSDWE